MDNFQSDIISRLERLEEKLDAVKDKFLAFKWQVIGFSSAVAFLLTLCVDLLRK